MGSVELDTIVNVGKIAWILINAVADIVSVFN